MNVFVIGSRGFTGRHLVERLRRNARMPVSEASEHGLDLRRPETIATALEAVRPDVVVNLGAISFVDAKQAQAL